MVHPDITQGGNPTKQNAGTKLSPLWDLFPGPVVTEDDFRGGKWFECAPALENGGLSDLPDRGDKPIAPDQGDPKQQKKKRLRDSKKIELYTKHLSDILENRDTLLEQACVEYRAWLKKLGLSSGLDALTRRNKLADTADGSAAAAKFRSTAAKQGTRSDKIAALTLSVQESPIHHHLELQELIETAKDHNRRNRISCIQSIQDLLLHDLLPDARSLKSFSSSLDTFAQHFASLTKRHILYALYEDKLKALFGEFLSALDVCAKDAIAHVRLQVVQTLYSLLKQKPEKEQAILTMLVNKFGDPDRKIASKATFCLHLVLLDHPAMKLIVVRDVGALVTRPHVNERSLYCAATFLNQLRFANTVDAVVALKAIQIYLILFRLALRNEQNRDSKAENKPKASGKKRKGNGEKHTPQAVPSVGVESKLLGAILTGINRAFPYAEHADQSIQEDPEYEKQYEDLFVVAHSSRLGTAVQALSLLFRISQSKISLKDRFYRALYDRLGNAEHFNQSKNHALFLNLIFKSMKYDSNLVRIKALAKRLLQAALQSSASFAAGSLLIVSQVMILHHSNLLDDFISISEQTHMTDDDNNTKSEASKMTVNDSTNGVDLGPKYGDTYDINHRDPLYAKADTSCLWELLLLTQHYHPSVAKFAQTLFSEVKVIEYDGDPLRDFSSGTFLERFVLKTPKASVIKSLHQRQSTPRLGISTTNFQERIKKHQVEEDEKFYIRYFEQKPLHNFVDKPNPRKVVDLSNDEEVDRAFDEALREEMNLNDNDMDGDLDSDVDGDDDLVDDEEFQAALGEEIGSLDSDGDDRGNADLDDSDEESMDEEDEGKSGKARKKKRDANASAFAPADDYEDILAEYEAMDRDGAFPNPGSDGADAGDYPDDNIHFGSNDSGSDNENDDAGQARREPRRKRKHADKGQFGKSKRSKHGIK